jgi:hypothetical protein
MPSPNPAGPRPWLLAAPIPHGPWRLLLYLWTYGPHWEPGDPLPAHGEVKAWPWKSTAAADLGQPAGTIDTWVKRLTRLGWIRREGEAWALAVGEPCQEWIQERASQTPPVSQTPRGVQLDPGGGLASPP